MEKIKIGFVGAGYMGQIAHIANYAILPDVELTALAEGRLETAKAVAQHYGIKAVYKSYQEMLQRARLDAVVAIMHFNLHHKVVPEILERDLPLFTEKPICVRFETSKKILRQIRGKGNIYQIGYMKRCDLGSRYVKEKIVEWRQSKEFGNLNYLRVTMAPGGDWTFGMDPPIDMGDKAFYDKQVPEPPPRWMTKKQTDAYIEFLNFYSHQVNLIRYLLDEDYSIIYVSENGKIVVAKSKSGIDIVFEIATYQAANEWHEFYEVFFDKGKIRLSLPAPLARQHAGEVEIYENKGKDVIYRRPVIMQRWSMLEQARFFVDTVKTKKKPISPASDAVKDLEIAEEYVKILFGTQTMTSQNK